MKEFSRKVVGEDVIIEEYKYTKMESKNVHREIIERSTYNAYILECGHKAYKKRDNAKTLHCHACSHPDLPVFRGLS